MVDSYRQLRENILIGIDTIIIGAYYDYSIHTMEIVRACIATYCGSLDPDIIIRINQLIFTWNARCIPGTSFSSLSPPTRINPEEFCDALKQRLFESYYACYLAGFYSMRESIQHRLLFNVGIRGAFAIDKMTMAYPQNSQNLQFGDRHSIQEDSNSNVVDSETVSSPSLKSLRAQPRQRKTKKNVVFENT